MTKEELEKEAEKFLGGWLIDPEIVKLLVDFAEPREKQIQIDAEQIRALQKQNGELTDKVKELEAQIEKMKCCGNCEFGCIACGNYLCELLLNNCNSILFHCDKWEIKEK